MKDLRQHIQKGVPRFLFLLSFIFVCLFLSAQSLSVESFKMLENDLTANTTGTTEYDQNGEVAALIKIITTETGFAFDGGMLGIVKTEQKVSEIWVYVPRGIQRIKIMHQQLGQVEYYFPISIQSARTYEMKLISGRVKTIIQDEVAAQFVTFRVTPQNAIVTIDNNQYSLQKDGTISQLLPYGTHSYRIEAPGFKSESGVVEIEKERIEREVNLVSTRGIVTLECSMKEAEIYLNGNLVGTGSWTGELDAAMYQVEVKRDGYSTRKTSFTLKSMEERTISLPVPQPVYGTISVTSQPIGATVYVDGTEVGTTPLLKSEILTGHREVEFRKKDYRPITMIVDVKEEGLTSFSAEMTDIFITNITSEPEGAILTINGECKGTTPFNGEISSGDYIISLDKNGYIPYKKKTHLDANNPKLHIPLLNKILYSDNFYIEGDYQIGHIMGISLLSGFYFHNCNFEIGVIKPIDDSEIMWPYYEDPFTIKTTFSINTGYGLLFGNRLRITPRVGMTYYRIVKDQNKDDLEMESYVISGSTGIRLEYSPIQNIGIVCTPVYNLPITAGNVAKQMDEITCFTKEWCKGFSINLGVELIF